MNDIHDQSLIDEFIAYSRDSLEAIEPDLLSLERDGAQVSTEIINRVFRTMHSIKGSAGFFGFHALKRLSHVMENVFMKFRDGEKIPDPDTIDTLLAGADKVRLLVEALNTGEEVSYQEELNRLNALLECVQKQCEASRQELDEAHSVSVSYASDVVLAVTDDGMLAIHVKNGPELEEVVFSLAPEELLSARSTIGQWLYAVWIDPVEDFKDKMRTKESFLDELKPLGKILWDDFDIATAEPQGANFHLLFGTVIDAGLIEGALEVPAARIKILDKKLLDIEAATSQPSSDEKASVKKSPEKIHPQKTLPKTTVQTVVTKSSETIRVNMALIDKLMKLAGELILGRNRMQQELLQVLAHNPKLSGLIQDVDTVTSDVQENIMRMRMQPVGTLFNKFIRIVRDLSRQLNKEASLFIEGKTVELDKTILEGLADPLIHLIRNCMDHALEPPEERGKKGKPRAGKIVLKAYHERGQVNILVADDGKGIDPVAVAEKAVSIGGIDMESISKMSNKEKLNLVFLPGLSTTEIISEVSGRGVGMDVVKTNIERLGGHIELDSVVDEGTTVLIRLPLTLAIIPSLIVGSGGQQFAIPQVNVQELIRIRVADVSLRIEKLGDVDVLRLREKLLPLICLADVLELERTIVHPMSKKRIKDRRRHLTDRRKTNDHTPRDEKAAIVKEKRERQTERRHRWQSDINVVVLRLGAYSFGITVDELFNNQEIVVNPLSKHLEECKCFSGTTFMGNGKVVMILDASGIAEFSKLNFSEVGEEELRRKEKTAKNRKDAQGRRRTILLFNNSPNEQFAFKLDEISRLEKINPDSIHSVGARKYIKYRDEGLPIINLEKLIPVSAVAENAKELFVILPKTETDKSSAGIVVSRIVDTVETETIVRKDVATPPGVSGFAFIDGVPTMFLNPNELLKIFEGMIDAV